jgi:hypothetical protein
MITTTTITTPVPNHHHHRYHYYHHPPSPRPSQPPPLPSPSFMKHAGIAPDAVTYHAMISIYEKNGEPGTGTSLLTEYFD